MNHYYFISKPCDSDRTPPRPHPLFPWHLKKTKRAVLGSIGNATSASSAKGGSGGAVEFSEPRLLEEFEEGNAALDKLREMGIDGALYEHGAAMTVEEQAKALGSVAGDKTKNLFLKVGGGGGSHSWFVLIIVVTKEYLVCFFIGPNIAFSVQKF